MFNNKLQIRKSAQEMDEAREYNFAYEYLCHLEEAKIWMESVLKEPLPPTADLEENLRNGVYLAKVGNFIAPDVVPLSRIYDIFQHRYRSTGLQFRHTDNINYWIEALKSIGFPKMFIVETTDVYEKKNMPKVIYCIHALSAHLFKLGQAPIIQNLYGKVQFSKQCIDSVCHEIQKSGLTLPSFQKIGGLLEKEFTTDSEALHLQIINFDKAINEQSEEKLLEILNSPTLNLVQVMPEYISNYLTAFKMAKEEKVIVCQNRSLSKIHEPDIYDELLNQSEIQGHIRKVNIDCMWQDILKAVKKKKRENIKEIIAVSFAEIKDYNKENLESYTDEALALDLVRLKSNKCRDTIQTIIRNGNRNAKEISRTSEAINRIKNAVLNKNKEGLLTALRAPCLKLSSYVSEFAAPLYLEELEADLKMSGELTFKDIKCSVTVLNEIAKITSAIDSCDCESTWTLLSSSGIPFMNIDSTLKTQYFKSLCACRQQKVNENVENRLLTFVDIQECIDWTNYEDSQQTKALMYIEEINESVKTSNLQRLLPALQGLVPGEISPKNAPLCMHLLKKSLNKKQHISDEELWFEDIKSVVTEVDYFSKKAKEMSEKFAEKNMTNNVSETKVLKSIENCDGRSKANQPNHPVKSPAKNIWSPECWVVVKMRDGVTAYINPAKKTFEWSKPAEVNGGKLQFIHDNLKILRDSSFKKLTKGTSAQSFIPPHLIIRLQAIIRGYLLRREVQKRFRAIIVIQKWWRSIRLRKKYLIAELEKNHLFDLDYYSKNVDKIIKIQAAWRGYQCRRKFPYKPSKSHAPVEFSFHLLKCLALSRKIDSHDYSTDLKVQTMKSCVVETIKMNQDLAEKLKQMDIKIGLLVQNRMSVESIIAESKKLQNNLINGSDFKGIKAFSKEAKKLLDGYQQLFYLLQIDPAYLTRLIVQMPSKSNHVIQSCVFSIFNYGSNSRDAYLLLRLFRYALCEEIRCKFQRPVDAITGNPLVLRLAVAFARQADGHNPLRNILGFLIEKVLNDKVFIDTNPVDIYRRWINQMETASGKRSDLPISVTQEEALRHPEVVRRLNHNLRILKSWVRCFLDRLSNSVNMFPYALRFIAKLLKNALLQKFPQTPEKDILKIVGNLVYYQYINSAIVAPDAFYIVSLPPNQPMKMEQRRNLASIAKILHFAATKKGFGEESKYLMCLNPFIVECHEEMKRFCRNCCDVEDLEKHFRMTKYSEATLIEKPRIYITLEEIRECHKLLLEVRQEVAPDPMDPMHDILDDLGNPPSLGTLIGCNNSSESTLFRAGKIQVCLELDNKFQSPPEDCTEWEKLFIKTKELISSRLGELKGETLSAAILEPQHIDIATNLAKLELVGLVKSSDDYQDILKSLIKDVFNKQEYRKLQNQEINVLRTAQLRLNEKRKFYEDQLAYYEEYLRACLTNLTAHVKPKKKERSVKYSGIRLREKGILISLDGVPPGQLKNVQFEISTTKFNGIYSVHGRFMGIEVETIDIDIQDLLKRQFEGLREIDLFGKARINVNLLLHLLNKKFHARI